MIPLFLREPNWNEEVNSNSVEQIMNLLKKLEFVICSLVTCRGRSEGRIWLSNTVSGITFITPRQQRGIFVDLLRSKPRKWGLASQLIQIVFEKNPQKAGAILAKRSYVLEKFFEGNPKRILQWFSDFADGGGSEHRRGAKALSHFAFTNRDFCWEELEWKGRHGQSPAVVATKPHYFLDLDVEKTIENFLENVPEFWSSNEFAESLKDGQILFLDTMFFVDLFVDLMYKEDSADVWEVINEFLMEESFSTLTNHLLITLDERDFCIFLEMLRDYINPRMEPKDFGKSSYWIEIILSKFNDHESIDQLLLLNAIINQGRQLLLFVCDDDSQDEKGRIKDIMSEIVTRSDNANILAAVLEECSKIKTTEAMKLLGLLSWVIYYILSEKCQDQRSWESLFLDNGITFRRSDKYAMVDYDELSEENEFESGGRSSSKRKHGKKSSRKKRRKKLDDAFINNGELLDGDILTSGRGLQDKGGSWLLSTDGFSAPWTCVDLPEHLSRHCLSRWMTWLVSRRNGVP